MSGCKERGVGWGCEYWVQYMANPASPEVGRCLCVKTGRVGWGGEYWVQYIANTASPDVGRYLCVKREGWGGDVSTGCSTWPTLPVLR